MRVHANSTVVLLMPGGPQAIHKGQDVDENDPRVQAYPWLFTDDDETDEEQPRRRRRPGPAITKPGETR